MALTTVENTINPIKCTGTASADEEILANPVFIRFIYWYNPTTAGHLLSLVDDTGNDIVVGRCETDGESQWLPVYTRFDAIHCDKMESGTLYIYIS